MVASSDADTIVYPSLVNVKSSQVLSDPYNGTTNPKRIPGSAVRYDVTITNTGQGTVNSNTVFVFDAGKPDRGGALRRNDQENRKRGEGDS